MNVDRSVPLDPYVQKDKYVQKEHAYLDVIKIKIVAIICYVHQNYVKMLAMLTPAEKKQCVLPVDIALHAVVLAVFLVTHLSNVDHTNAHTIGIALLMNNVMKMENAEMFVQEHVV